MTESEDSLSALQARYGVRYRWMLLGSVMVGTVASVMSSTIVNVAIPDMSHYFGLGQDRAQWVSSGFMAAMTVSMLTTPWLLGRWGYRRVYQTCMWLLLLGGIAGGLARHFPLVLAARVAEGLAAGVVQPIPAIIMLRAFESRDQGRASALFGMGVVLAPALGPSIGGVLVDWFGWRSIFFMIAPFCVASLWLASRYVPVTAPGGAAGRRDARLDWVGLVLGGSGTLLLLNGLVQIRHGGPAAVGLLVAAALSLGAFAVWVLRLRARGGEPLLDLRVFAYPTFAMGSIVAFIYGTALFGSTYLLPVYMQMGLRIPASHSGTILLPAGIVLAVVIGAVGRITHRVATRVLVTTGLGLLAASFLLMPVMNLGSALGVLVALAILGRIGLGFILPSLNIGAMRPLDKALIPQAASTINFLRMLGGSVGVSVCAIVLEWRLAAHGDVLTQPSTSAARLAAFNESFLMLGTLCLLAMIAAWRLRERSK